MKSKITLLTAISIAFFLIVFSLKANVTLALGSNMLGYYGGSIQSVTYCTCYYDMGVLLTIKDLSKNGQSLKIFYSPFFSKLRSNFNIFKAGPNVVGAYSKYSKQCQMTSGYTCTSNETADGVIDFIIGIGSSLK